MLSKKKKLKCSESGRDTNSLHRLQRKKKNSANYLLIKKKVDCIKNESEKIINRQTDKKKKKKIEERINECKCRC